MIASIPATPATADSGVNRLLARLAATRAQAHTTWDSQIAAAPQSIACPRHPLAAPLSLDAERTREASHARGVLAHRYANCVLCEQDRVRQSHVAAWTRRGVPARLAEATLDDYDGTASVSAAEALATTRDYVRSAVERVGTSQYAPIRGGFLVLVGDSGLGKSHLAAAALRAIRPHLFCVPEDVIYTTQARLLIGLRGTYGARGQATQHYVEQISECPALVLDEVGVSSGGADEGPLLQTILAERYDARRPTILVSNLDLGAVENIVGHRVTDRIAENCHIAQLTGESYRRGAILAA